MRVIAGILIIIFLAVAFTSCGFGETKILKGKQKVLVTRVIDGDTIVVNNKYKVRLVGIDTPELNHPVRGEESFGREALDFTRKMLDKKVVYLDKDVSETDRYGRLLRYVYLKDGTFFNELIVREGYARVYTVPPDVKHVGLLLRAEKYAKRNNRGLWASKG